jgi:hypothetical protein
VDRGRGSALGAGGCGPEAGAPAVTPFDAIAAQLGAPHMELTWEDLERYRGHIVYVWTRGGEVLYVGLSFNGFERPLARNHERLRDFEPGDRLTVWRAPAEPGALYDVEADLIQRLHPDTTTGRARVRGAAGPSGRRLSGVWLAGSDGEAARQSRDAEVRRLLEAALRVLGGGDSVDNYRLHRLA